MKDDQRTLESSRAFLEHASLRLRWALAGLERKEGGGTVKMLKLTQDAAGRPALWVNPQTVSCVAPSVTGGAYIGLVGLAEPLFLVETPEEIVEALNGEV